MRRPFADIRSYYLTIKIVRIIMAFCENKDALKLNVLQSNLFELYVGFTLQRADTLFVFRFKHLRLLCKNSQFFYLKRTHSSIAQANISTVWLIVITARQRVHAAAYSWRVWRRFRTKKKCLRRVEKELNFCKSAVDWGCRHRQCKASSAATCPLRARPGLFQQKSATLCLFSG